MGIDSEVRELQQRWMREDHAEGGVEGGHACHYCVVGWQCHKPGV
jgi:hypothetical protein